MRRFRTHTLLFASVVLVCLAQVGWWTWFQFRETGLLEEVGRRLTEGDVPGALSALGASSASDLAEQARRRRLMFVSEGAALSLLVLFGLVYFYLTLLRERRMHATQERFLAGTTHALKTPLATLQIGLETLRAHRLPDARQEVYLDALLDQTRRLEDGIGNLLAAANLQTRAIEVSRTEGDLMEDVRQAVEEMTARYRAAEVALTVAGPSQLVMSRDPAALRLVLHNLLDNGAKFTPRGGSVQVLVMDNGNQAEIHIVDTGPGIDPEDLPHLFQRFYRGRRAIHVGGTGLGLYIAQHLVASHGGTITAGNTSDGGAVFTMKLPRGRSR